jgi:crossover junction endodeoxyribonuclease RuvC
MTGVQSRYHMRVPRYASRSWRTFDPTQTAKPVALATPAFPCRVLGLDPGSLRTGFGIVDCSLRGEMHVASGCIRTRGDDLARRLREIHEAVRILVEEHRPDEVAIERVFMHRNADSALKLGQARGAALSAAVTGQASVFEYAPRAIKLAVVGTGAADKAQVSHMVRMLLKIPSPTSSDASDALGVALCHALARRASRMVAMAANGSAR